jgi:uncharacterized protein (TIGR03437 family)
VNHGTAPGEARNVRIAARAPSLFPQVELAGGVATAFGIGFGLTSPGLESGQVVPTDRSFTVAGVTATIGGQAAEVLEASAVPGLPGLTKVRVATGGRTGALVVRLDGVSTNAVALGQQ